MNDDLQWNREGKLQVLGNDVYTVLLVGLISFDFGGLLIGYGTINKSSIYVNTYTEEYEDDEIDYGISIVVMEGFFCSIVF